jgi:dUTP pyrophosphatase
MTENIKDLLTSIPGTGDVMSQFITILELPDTQFNSIYYTAKNEILKAFNSNAVRKDILNQLETTPIENLDAELAGLQEIINEINQDSSLSDKKKDLLITTLEQSGELIKSIIKIPRELISVKIQKISEDAILPKYAHDEDAGADIYAVEEVICKPHSTNLIKTGIKVAIPAGFEIQIRPRSGLSLNTSMRIANTPGTIDAGYRGEVCVIMENTGNLSYTINKGDKIAQMVIMPVPMIKWEEVDELDTTERNENGFGSTDQE